VEILFLGTGGGRFNLISQLRRTAGFCILGGLNIYVDPGPGALVACKEFGFDPRKIDALVVTHNHVDHTNDAGILAEAMTDHATAKKGAFIGSKTVIEGDEFGDKGITHYHLGKVACAHEALYGHPIAIRARGKTATLIPAPVRHEDATGFGFTLEMGGKKIGYTSDTEYYAGMARHYAGCDALIANNLKAKADDIPAHMNSDTTIRLLAEAKPKLAILTHLGRKLILSGPEKEAKKIAKASGVRTIAAKDGMKIRA